MLPVKLIIQGINSYQNEQIIEFDKLLDSKIFGIFGAVGSGKSTILEAISYALYGKYEKLKGEKVSYNIMNLKSKRFLIDFEFVVEDTNRYRFVVEGRRNSKRDEDVTTKRHYYEWSNNEWIPKEKLDAKDIIGLSYENFNRTIIIPQGKFMEFIHLSGAERTKMLKEIFNLYQFDLLDKVSVLQRKNDNDLSNLEGKLSQLENINKELITTNKKSLKNILRQLKTQRQQLKAKKEDLKIFESIKTDFLKLKQLKEKYILLLNQKPQIEKSEKTIKEYEFCAVKFKADIDRLEETKRNILSLEQKQSDIEEILKKLNNDFENINKKVAELTKENEKLDNFKSQRDDFEIIVNIRKEQKDIDTINSLLSKSKKEFENIKTLYESTNRQLSEIKKQISTKEKQMPDLTVLSEIKSWFSNVAEKQKTIVEIINSMTDKRLMLKRMQNSTVDIFEDDDIKMLNIDTSLQLNDLIDLLQTNIDNWLKGLKNLQIERDDIVLKDRLKEFAHSLKAGKPCPVCGALEHPNPLKADSLKNELENIYKRIENGENLINKTQTYIDKLKELKMQIENEKNNIKEQEQKLLEKKQQLGDFINTFKWKEFSPESPEKVNLEFENAEKLKSELLHLKEEFVKKEKEEFKEKEKLESISEKLLALSEKLSAMNAKSGTLKSQLKILDYNDFNSLSISEIENRKNTLDNKIQHISSEYEKNVELKNNLELELTKIKAGFNNVKENLKNLQDTQSQISSKLYKILNESGYDDIDQIKEILKQDLNIEKMKKSINDFNINLHSTSKEMQIIEEKLKDIAFDEAKYNKIKNEIDNSEEEIEKLIAEKSRLENLITEQELKLKEKRGYLKDKMEKELRAEDLKLMRSLFSGNGFVNYISTVRLQEVVNYANTRFMKLTRGRLKLELNNDNSFNVIDFLNEGKQRSIKTLSGGQTFQASLSLALALASIVQQQNKSNQNFFFLDEGFGTQDEESLRLVFDTIKSLRKENRIVGLISHVDELKEEVNTYLEILNNNDTGSHIVKSWER